MENDPLYQDFLAEIASRHPDKSREWLRWATGRRLYRFFQLMGMDHPEEGYPPLMEGTSD